MKKWNGRFFERTTLRALGLKIQLGHRYGKCAASEECKHPLTVIDLSGIHEVTVRWCHCQNLTERVQLLRAQWFPASIERPATAMTFDVLRFYHLLTWQAKTSMYDFYETLLKRVDNSGIGRHYVGYPKEEETVTYTSRFSPEPIS